MKRPYFNAGSVAGFPDKVWLGLKREEKNPVFGELGLRVDGWDWNWLSDGVPAGRSPDHWAGYYPGYSNWKSEPTRTEEGVKDCAVFNADGDGKWEWVGCQGKQNVMCCYHNPSEYDCVDSLVDKADWPLVPLYIRDNEMKDDVPSSGDEIVHGFATDHS